MHKRKCSQPETTWHRNHPRNQPEQHEYNVVNKQTPFPVDGLVQIHSSEHKLETSDLKSWASQSSSSQLEKHICTRLCLLHLHFWQWDVWRREAIKNQFLWIFLQLHMNILWPQGDSGGNLLFPFGRLVQWERLRLWQCPGLEMNFLSACVSLEKMLQGLYNDSVDYYHW